jgi:hypothetical protein
MPEEKDVESGEAIASPENDCSMYLRLVIHRDILYLLTITDHRNVSSFDLVLTC